MEKENSGYKSAFKATALLGGVQVITIIIGIIKTKLISLWLGPSGFGVLSLFNSTVALISSVSNFGLASSAVRDISKAHAIDDGEEELANTIKAINRSVIITGLLGVIVTILFSKYISIWTFGNDEYAPSFILLSIVVFINGLYGGQYATLQGVRRLRDMSKARIWGSLIGVVLTLPFYYMYRENGIVIALIINSLLTLSISYYYTLKIKLPRIKQNFKESLRKSRSTLKLGIMMAVSAIAVSVVEFIVKTYISNVGGVGEVGLYQAGWTLNTSYLGLVFTAMATDYFPRLSAISNDNKMLAKRINEQAEIAILIIAPLIALMISFMPFVISILYTSKFESISLMTCLLMLGALVKSASWSISFVFLAKGDGKTFLFNELGIKFITLPSYVLAYYYWGLSGIGLAYISNYLIYAIWVFIVAFRKYSIGFERNTFKLILLFTLACSLLLICSLYSNKYSVFIQITLFLFILFYAFFELNKRINILNFIYRKIKK